jgi:crossover junction endodeoxyribonuclease RuvC
LIILGIDPGYATTGYGIIEKTADHLSALDYGVITTDKRLPQASRILQTVSDLLKLVKAYKPGEIAMEELFFSKNTTTGLKVAECRGAILFALSRLKTIPFEYKPNQIKQNICGYGGAPKIQIQKMVQILLNLDSPPQPDDAADALAIAICHANHLKTNLNIAP